MPARLGLPPDRLAEGQRRLDRRRRPEEEQVAGDRPAVIVEDDGQPGLSRLARVIRHEEVELGVIGLPDGVGPRGLGAMDEVEGIAVCLRPLVSQCHQRRLQRTDHHVDRPVARNRFAEPGRDERGLAVHSRGREVRPVQREPFDELLEGRGHLACVPIVTGSATEPSQSELAVVGGPTAHRAHAQFVFLGNLGEGYALFQVRTDDLEPTERRVALVRAQAVCAGMWSLCHGLRRIIG